MALPLSLVQSFVISSPVESTPDPVLCFMSVDSPHPTPT